MTREHRVAGLVGLCGALTLGCGPSGCEEQHREGAEQSPDPIDAPLPRPISKARDVEAQAPPELELESALSSLRDYRSVDYRAPSDPEAEEYQTWLESIGSTGWAGRLPSSKAPSGFSARWLDGGKLWLLCEEQTSKRGAGAVVLRPSPGSDLVIEIPHSFFDSSTLPIGVDVFRGARARALLVNTYHRGGQGASEERKELALSGDSPFDVAHIQRSYFSAAHRSLTQLVPTGLFVQLHGFSDSSARGVDVIVSAAETKLDVGPVAEQLSALLSGFEVRRYPDQVRVLGGTTNVQARVSREDGVAFLHLEMSKRLRKRLSEDPELARRIGEVLAAVAEQARGG